MSTIIEWKYCPPTLRYCPKCRTTKGQKDSHPNIHALFEWCIAVLCPTCSTTWHVCVYCPNSRSHMTTRRQLTTHQHQRHSEEYKQPLPRKRKNKFDDNNISVHSLQNTATLQKVSRLQDTSTQPDRQSITQDAVDLDRESSKDDNEDRCGSMCIPTDNSFTDHLPVAIDTCRQSVISESACLQTRDESTIFLTTN